MRKIKKNYLPWRIDEGDYPESGVMEEKLRFLINFAGLAPSSHNSQPWVFTLKNNIISIKPDNRRFLPVCDPMGRLMNIALGCALENLLIAADYFDFSTDFDYLTDEKEEEIKVFFQPKKTVVDRPSDHLIFSIKKRQTNREKYRNQLPTQSFLDWLKSLSDNETIISLVSEKGEKREIIDLLLSARNKIFDDKDFRKELSKYKKTNLTNSPVGIPGFTMGFPTLASLFAPFVIRHFNVVKLMNKQDYLLLDEFTPLFVIISTREDKKRNWFGAGRLFERIALEAVKRGVETAFQVAPSGSLKQILRTDYYPQIFFRIGYALHPKMKHSPRLSLEEVMKNNN